MNERKELTSISIDLIYPHPDNPRKNLGNLEEMIESIKKNGVMQNLTVIPGHYLTEDELKMLYEMYKDNPDEEIRVLINRKWSDEGYTLLIGHRRFASAKLAGLKDIPCRIIEGMSRKEQVGIMLEENMQRNDLTIIEQAQGFQMMLDLGETVDTIVEKTGFSKSTVHHRLNIAKLDQKLLKDKEEDDCFQLSLKDLYVLEQIKDVETRNKVLKDASDQRQLRWKAEQAAREEKRLQVQVEIIKKLEELGVKKAPKKLESESWRWSGKWDIVKEFNLDKVCPEEIKLKKSKEDYMYIRNCAALCIIRKKVQSKKETEADKECKDLERKKKELKALTKELILKIKDYVKVIALGTIKTIEDSEELRKELLNIAALNGTNLYQSTRYYFFEGKSQWECSEEEKKDAENKWAKLKSQQILLILMAESVNTTLELVDYYGKYKKESADKLWTICRILEKYGWVYEENEQQLLDGTHELYVKEEIKC